MLAQQYYDSQTEITDSLLEELARLATNPLVNFNNTKQFDALLKHLESTLAPAIFVSVPSENILQILFTLAARCPISNWSHDSVYSFAGDTTEYMKMVNKEYDAALYKPTLQQRSARVLKQYLEILMADTSSEPVLSLSKNVRGVLGTFYAGDITSFFSPKKAKLGPNFSDDFLRSPVRLRRSPKKTLGSIDTKSAVPKPMEVISDSEESEMELSFQQSPELALSFTPHTLPRKSASSLSESSARTSGLGDTASLFHKSKQTSAPDSPDPEAGKPKKHKTLGAPFKRIQIFDDHLIAKKLSGVSRYDVWNLLRWTFWCAETSSEYQSFLFNSGETHVHHIYRSYRDFLLLFFGFCLVELRDKVKTDRVRSAIIARVLTVFGPHKEWREMAVAMLFSGLGIPSKERPIPCYERELILTKNDPIVLNSRCKTSCANNDDMDSMGLRVQILFLYMYYDLVQPARASASESLMEHVVARLCTLSLPYLKSFLTRFRSDLDTATKSSAHQLVFGNNPEIIYVGMCTDLVRKIVNDRIKIDEIMVNIKIDSLSEYWPWQVLGLIADENVYRSVVNDATFESIDLFCASWDTLLFLLETLFNYALEKLAVTTKGKQVEIDRIKYKVKQADRYALSGFSEYVNQRWVNSDLIPESSFTLSDDERDAALGRFTSSFSSMASFVLGVVIIPDPPEETSTELSDSGVEVVDITEVVDANGVRAGITKVKVDVTEVEVIDA